MHYAKDVQTGEVVAAENARRGRAYVCRRPECGGQVYLPNVSAQVPHFRHYPGVGSAECDEYYPSCGSGGHSPAPAAEAVEDDPAELGLLLFQMDAHWGLGMRLPEIPGEQLGAGSLNELRRAFVEVFAGSEQVGRVSALELRPGVGIARIEIHPGLQRFSAQPTGTWPSSVDKNRWLLECRGLEATGVLFRVRRGEWTRLLRNSAVHAGESLLLLADTRCRPPDSIVSETHGQSASGGLNWRVWEITLPDSPSPIESSWLARLGHNLLPRTWSVDLATPPRGVSEQGQSIYWAGDTVVIDVLGPEKGSETQATLKSGTNYFSASVRAETGRAYLVVGLRDVGPTRLSVAGERRATIEVLVVPRPSGAKLLEAIRESPRLRIWVGEHYFEAWQASKHKIPVLQAKPPEVLVDLGTDCARASVTVWDRGTRRQNSGLDAKSAGRLIFSSLASASRIEIDAGNFGRIELIPERISNRQVRGSRTDDRLRFYDRVLASRATKNESISTTAAIESKRAIGHAALIRARLASRCHREIKGDSK